MRFHRTFLMLVQEDAGYGTDQKIAPSGYVKIEAMGDRGRLSAMVQNLKEGRGGANYRLYIIKTSDGHVTAVDAGKIYVKGNRGEAKWEFNPDNVGGSGHRIEGFDAAVVAAEPAQAQGINVSRIAFPLAAFKRADAEWKEKLKRALYPNLYGKARILDDREKTAAKAEVEEEETAPRTVAGETAMEETAGEAVIKETTLAEEATMQEAAAEGASEMKEAGSDENWQARAGAAAAAEDAWDMTAEQYMPDSPGGAAGMPKAAAEEAQAKEDGAREAAMKGAEAEDDAAEGVAEKDTVVDDAAAQETAVKKDSTEPGFSRSYTPDMNTFPCARCPMWNMSPASAAQKGTEPASIDKFREGLEKCFKKCDPFHSGRRDYTWWKIDNPIRLNDVLCEYNVKTPMLFNHAAMAAHFKYGHMIIGIYVDRARQKEYIVCGIPGMYGIDERPYGDACRWVEPQGGRPRYGAFGYWLAYIDIMTGDFLRLK